MATTNDNYNLTILLSSTPYELAYAVPLLLISLVLTFAGAFLTLDRSRAFTPRYQSLPGSYDRPKRKFAITLDGGVGGLIIGFAFGVHLSTFLSLLIPSVSSSEVLSSPAFLAIWLLSSLPLSFVAGRWKYVAFAFSGISGGSLFALALSVIIHPALLTRVVFISICAPIVTLMTLLPLPRFRRGAMRFSCAATGAFGVVLAIGILGDCPAWADVWERLWVHDGALWGTGKEKGLSAAFCVFLAFGCASDWWLKRTFGECPDEKWDSYLANYAANLPNTADRAGTFQPLTSVWDRVFGSEHQRPPTPGLPPGGKDILFPEDDNFDAKQPVPPYSSQPSSPISLPMKLHKLSKSTLSPGAGKDGAGDYFQQQPGFLKKARSKKALAGQGQRKREGVKFRPLGDKELLSSDSEGNSEDEFTKASPLAERRKERPWLKQYESTTSNTPTLVGDNESTAGGKKGGKDEPIDYEKEIKKLGQLKSKRVTAGLGEGEVPEYSDYEEDITTPTKRQPQDKEKGWSPKFIERHRQTSNGSSQRTAVDDTDNSSGHHPHTPLGAVPATPSLLKALDRVALAQKDAFGQAKQEGMPQPTSPTSEGKGVRWDDFWKEVKDKARER